jgi:hypothetical protein
VFQLLKTKPVRVAELASNEVDVASGMVIDATAPLPPFGSSVTVYKILSVLTSAEAADGLDVPPAFVAVTVKE